MLKRIYHHFDEHVETYLASVALITFAALIVLQVTMRYVFNTSLTWTVEMARYALVWFVFLSGSYAVRYQRHVKFSVLVDLLGKRVPIAQRIVQIFVFVLWLAFLVFVAYLSWESVVRQYGTGQVAPATQIPMYLIYLALPIGLALMAFRVTQHLVRASIDIVKHPHAPVGPTQHQQSEVD